MSRWSLFFLIIPVFGVGIWAASNMLGCDLPENISAFGREIDHLYYVILWVTAIAFVATQAVLCYVLYRFGRGNPKEKVIYTHGNRNMEVAWTVGPAIILLFVALYQLPTYVKIRFPTEKPNVDPLARVVARQFEWRISYAGPDGKLDTPDDIHVVNDFHVAKNRRVLIDLRSMDVLHSFFLPNVRIKQDAVPGLSIPVWFDVHKSSREYQTAHCAFTKDSFKELGDLLVTLKSPKTKLQKFVAGKLSSEATGFVNNYDPTTFPDVATKILFASELNNIMNGPPLQAGDLLADSQASLSKDTKDHLADSQGAIYQTLLNRQILEDAFPHALIRHKQDFELVCAELCGWGHYKMRGRMVVHDTFEQFEKWLAETRAEQETSR